MARIPWSRIQDAFEGEWVELVDCAWRNDRLHPDAARVRHHSANRNELLEKIASSGRLDGAFVLFVGAIAVADRAQFAIATSNI